MPKKYGRGNLNESKLLKGFSVDVTEKISNVFSIFIAINSLFLKLSTSSYKSLFYFFSARSDYKSFIISLFYAIKLFI